MRTRFTLVVAMVAAVTLATAGRSSGQEIDLTSSGASSNYFGAIYTQNSDQPTGTGVFDPFVRIQAKGQEQGYNTSGSPTAFDEKGGPWTHNIQLNQLSVETIDGVGYYAFRLDINEQGNANSLLSLDQVQIYTSPTGSQTTSNVGSLGTLRYDLQANGPAWIGLDSALGSKGSGDADMVAFIPTSDFAGASPTDFLYLYSHFGGQGGDWSSGAGFEEWAPDVSPSAIPEASTALTVGLSVLSLVAVLRRRR